MPLQNTLRIVPETGGDPRVRVFRCLFAPPDESEHLEVDAYALITDRYVALLDTLLCPEDMAFVVEQLHDVLPGRQLLVINSHADWDHAWGNSYFSHNGQVSAPIIAHSHCFTRLRSAEAQAELDEYQQRYAVFQHVVLLPPTITFTHSLTLHGGDLTLELLPAPGHHADHIAAWIPELQLLLAFDAVERPIPIIGDKEGVQPMRQTLEHFLSLHPQRVLCSHGKTTTVAMVEQNLAYLRSLEERCQDFLHRQKPTEDEITQGAALINYPFREVIASMPNLAEDAFYTGVHDNNIACTLQFLMTRLDK